MTLQITDTAVAEFIGERENKPGNRWWSCGATYILMPRDGMSDEEIVAEILKAIEILVE